MKTKLDILNWNRRSHYRFFKDFDNPFYNICCNIDITPLYNLCQEQGQSFFLASLYLASSAANQIEELKYRIEKDEVYCYDKIHPYSTILNEDRTFNFCAFELHDSFPSFVTAAKDSIEAEKKRAGVLKSEERNDVIHFTSIPWISLTSITHPRNFNTGDSIPKMVFGKYFDNGNRKLIPFCTDVHHGLVDGYHVGQLFKKFEELIKNCGDILA